MKNLIGISGKIGSGKDTIGQIIQYYASKDYKIKKIADKTSTAFEVITGVNYHKLPRESKEQIRKQYRDFAQGQKNIFGDDVWLNALFVDYNEIYRGLPSQYESGMKSYPNWIITDVRFPNEFHAIKDRGGSIIRINRPINLRFPKLWKMYTSSNKYVSKSGGFLAWLFGVNEEMYEKITHPSETSLDDFKFDHIIENNLDIESLGDEVINNIIK